MEQSMIKKCLVSLLAVGLFTGQACLCRAVTFAEVKSIVSTSDATKVQYQWSNGTTTFTTVPSPTPIVFAFDALGAPSGLNDVNATMTVTAVAPPGPAGFYNPLAKIQPLANLTFTINAVGGMGYAPGQLLLKGMFQTPGLPDAFLQQSAPNTATLTSSSVPLTPGGLILMSPFFMIDPAQTQTATWSFSTITPPVFTQTGNYLSDIPLLNGNGNFAATVTSVPEPSTWSALAAAGFVGFMFVRRRKR
jgi:hypothetical protein